MTALFALAFLSGCISGPPPASPGTAANLTAAFESRLAFVDDYSMTVLQTASWGGKEIDILYKRPYQYLLENRYGDRTWTQSVRNLNWTEYHPDTNTADVLAIHNPESCFPPVSDPNRLALDVLSSGAYNLSDPVSELLDGRPAYRIDGINTRAADNFGEGRLGTVSVWIDRDQLLVVKIAASDSSGTPVTAYRVRDLAVNTGIPDSAFVVTVPEGTKIRHPAPFCPETTPSLASPGPGEASLKTLPGDPPIPFGSVMYHSSDTTTVFDSQGRLIFTIRDNESEMIPSPGGYKPATRIHEVPSGSVVRTVGNVTTVEYDGQTILTVIESDGDDEIPRG